MASGVGLNEACKQVAAETDKEHGYFWIGDLLGQKIGTCPNSTNEKLVHVPTLLMKNRDNVPKFNYQNRDNVPKINY